MSLISTVFMHCVSAVRSNVLIERANRRDKEYHFQNWFKSRLDDLGEHYDEPRRNTYPDFKIVRHPEGYELKGLAYPRRMVNFDCNSQPPCGEHNGRQVYYVFGRYPAQPDDDRYPVLDFGVRTEAQKNVLMPKTALKKLLETLTKRGKESAKCAKPERLGLTVRDRPTPEAWKAEQDRRRTELPTVPAARIGNMRQEWAMIFLSQYLNKMLQNAYKLRYWQDQALTCTRADT